MLKENKGIIITVILCVGFLIGLSFLGGGGKNDTAQSVNPLDQSLLQVQSDDWVKGNIEGSVVLTEYLDFECEACRAYYPFMKQASEEFNNDVRFVARYFPNPGHKNAMTAALAVEASGQQGKFWEMHDLLFENQKNWGEKQKADSTLFEVYAQQLGLDMEKFKADVQDMKTKERVERDFKTGIQLGVSGTPTFYLNGKKIQVPREYEAFKKLIQYEIATTSASHSLNIDRATP